MRQKVAVIGQGYVGLPLSITFAEAGYEVLGIDIDAKRINQLNLGISQVEDIEAIRIQTQLKNRTYRASTNYFEISSSEVVIICVPTPLLQNREPDLSHLINCIKSVSENIKPGSLLVIESTIAPGTTRNIIIPLIEQVFGPIDGKLDLAFSPERVDPKNTKWNISNTPKLVAGITQKALRRACELYSGVVLNLVECSSVEVAETAKLLENTFRLVNISFVNEFRIFCDLLKINVNEVIEAASSKPYGFMPFYPSVGVGGHCIPVDPIYLSNKAKEIGAPTKFIDLADQVNRATSAYIVKKAGEKINGLNNKRILVVGVAYKPNLSDVRETPVKAMISEFKIQGAIIAWHDDLVGEWDGEKSTKLTDEYDLAIIATAHDYLDLSLLGNIPVIHASGSIT
jgi:UDP-N-acetyl-D-glucosamine dehydrogenase